MKRSSAPGTRLFIGVIGLGSSDPIVEAAALDVGREVAAAGAVLVCGGLGGAMEAACRGAREKRGTTVGILPGDNRAEANSYVEIAIPTGLGEVRNVLVVKASDGLIAIGGGWGTLSEIGFALKLEKPVVGLDTWELSKKGELQAGIAVANSPGEAVRVLLDKL